MKLSYFRGTLVLLSSLLLLVSTGLRSDAVPGDAETEASGGITRLVLRNYEITISAGSDGVTLYDVHSQSGQVLDANLTTEQLQANYPTVYNSLYPAVAQSDEMEPVMLLMDVSGGY